MTSSNQVGQWKAFTGFGFSDQTHASESCVVKHAEEHLQPVRVREPHEISGYDILGPSRRLGGEMPTTGQDRSIHRWCSTPTHDDFSGGLQDSLTGWNRMRAAAGGDSPTGVLDVAVSDSNRAGRHHDSGRTGRQLRAQFRSAVLRSAYEPS